jgi:hypothetical protein
MTSAVARSPVTAALGFTDLVERVAAEAPVENAILDPTPAAPRLLALAADGRLFGGAAQDRTGSSGAPPETKPLNPRPGSLPGGSQTHPFLD